MVVLVQVGEEVEHGDALRVEGALVRRTITIADGLEVERRRGVRLLHDGRARSIEEAIEWHGGAGAASRAAFEKLAKQERDALLAWIATL